MILARRVHFNSGAVNLTPGPSPKTGEGSKKNRGYFTPFRGKISPNLSPKVRFAYFFPPPLRAHHGCPEPGRGLGG